MKKYGKNYRFFGHFVHICGKRNLNPLCPVWCLCWLRVLILMSGFLCINSSKVTNVVCFSYLTNSLRHFSRMDQNC